MPKKNFVYLFFLILVIIFFWEVIFLGKTFIFRDIARSYYPFKHFVAENIRSGILPLWNQYIACGYPFFASLNSEIFYPPSVLYYILPFQSGFNMFYLVHYFFALIFMYLLAKDFNLSTLSSLFASLCFTFSGYFISIFDTPSFTPATWLPLTFLLFRRSLLNESNKNLYTIFAGFSLSMEFLNGDPIIWYCTFIILFIYLVVMKAKLTSYLRLFLIFFIASGISAIQLIPTLELFKLSFRTDLSYDASTYWSLPPLHLINLLVPFSFGDFTLSYTDWHNLDEQTLLKSLYFGIFPLIFSFLVIFTLSKTKDRESIFLSLILYISLFLIFGKYTPIYKLLYNFVPGLSSMRFPVKFFFLTAFSFALLSGRGIDLLIFTKDRRQLYVKMLLIMSILIIILGILIFSFKDQIVVSFLKANLSKNLSLHETYSMAIRVNETISRVLQMFGLFTLGCLLIFLLRMKKISGTVFKIFAILILIIDIFPAGIKLFVLGPGNFYKEDEKNITFIKNNLDNQRIFLLCDDATKKVVYGSNVIEASKNGKKSLYPDWGVLYGISDVEGYEGVGIRRHLNLGYGIIKKGKKRISPLLDFLGVKYVITFLDLPKKFKFIREDYVKIYENPDYFPRAFVINKAKSVSADEGFRAITSSDFDPASYCFIEDEIQELNMLKPLKSVVQPANVIYPNPNKVIVEVHSNSDGYLVLTDNYYPGWKAYVDNKESKIYRAYYSFRAVKVDKGKHTVIFKYEPISFKIGFAITLVFLIGSVVFLIFLRKKN